MNRWDLPEDLFDPGEKRPPKPKKGAKKRAAAEVNPEHGNRGDSRQRPAADPGDRDQFGRLLTNPQDQPPPAKRQHSSVAAAG